MKTHPPPPDPRHVTGYHEFLVFTDDDESYSLFAVQAGIPITHVLAAARRMMDGVIDYETERLVLGRTNLTDTWASRWLLAMAEGLLASARKGNIETIVLR